MPSKEAAQLQHSSKFVEKEDPTIVRQTTVATGDFYISRRTAHSDFNLTENDVKVISTNHSRSTAKSERNSNPVCVFTPDTGVKELVLTQAGTYPDGSVDSASGRGYFPSSLHGLDVMVKDSKRFGDTHDWGFFSFGHQAPPYQPTASVKSAGECASCHIAGVAKTDMVWVQYYPSLTTKTK